MTKSVILHIGLPKTRTTSIQYLFGGNRRTLRRSSFDYFSGVLGVSCNHVELYISSIRPGIETLAAHNFDLNVCELKGVTKQRINTFIKHSSILRHILAVKEFLS